jgi:hypothetical protein
MRDSTLAMPNVANDCVIAWAAKPTPKSRPPATRIGRLATRRVTKP